MAGRNAASSNSHSSISEESVLVRATEIGVAEVNQFHKDCVAALCGGGDIQIHSVDSDGSRAVTCAAWLSQCGGKNLILVNTAEKVESVKALLGKAGVEVESATDDGAAAIALGHLVEGSSLTIVGLPAALLAPAKKLSDKLSLDRVVVDSVDEIISTGNLTELEGVLNAVRENNASAQIVLLAIEPTLHLSALNRRFLNDSKTVSGKVSGGTRDAEHWYYEVGNTLLAKPQAMCDLLEFEEGAKTLVFCNSPSDADFADVILKKRGISSVKLIGYVPQLKLSKAVHQIQKGEVTVAVLTDVAARGVPLDEFEVVINYSVPADPEIYFHRYSSGSESRTRKVISLVSPLDITNFHYLKKLGKLDLQKGELPSAEQLFVGKIDSLRKQAVEKNLAQDPSLSALIDTVLKDGNARELVGLLLYNTLTVIPALKVSAAPQGREYDERSSRSDEGDDEYFEQPRGPGRRGGQRGDRGGRHDRNERGERGDRGGDRGNRRSMNASEGDEDYGDSQGQEGFDSEAPRRGRRRDNQDGDRGDRGERGDRRGSRNAPVDRETRLYVGHGARHGISKETLVSKIVEACGLGSDTVKRPQVRECYSFVDVPEAIADEVTAKLAHIDFGDSKCFVKKAVTLSIPREGGVEESPPQQLSQEGDGDSYGSEDDTDDRQPNLLSVDDPA